VNLNESFFLGVLTGLIPSLHPNNLVNFINKEYLIPIAILHSFINVIPNIYFLVPDIALLTNLNPIYQFYKEGEALKAVQLSGLASFLGVLFSLVFYEFPFIFLIYKSNYFPLILYLNLLLLSLVKEQLIKTLKSIIILVLSFILIKSYNFFFEDKFFLLTGFFGLSSVLTFPKNKIKQKFYFFNEINIKELVLFSFLGCILAVPANIFPLLTPTHFLITLALLINFNKERSIILVSSMNTSDFILSMITKEYFLFSRNYVIKEGFLLTKKEILIYSFLSFLILLLISFLINFLHNKIDRKVLNIFIFLSILWPIFLDLSLVKILFLILSSFLGFLCLKWEIERINLFNSYIIEYCFYLIKTK